MKALGVIACLYAFACVSAAEPSPKAPVSEYAQGSIRRSAGGWNVRTANTSFFVRDGEIRDVPEEIAPIAALFRARSAERRSDRWIINTRDGRIDVFKDFRDFTVTTPRESFTVIHEIGQDYRISPGRPGVRRISVEEYIDTVRELKEKPRQRKTMP